MARRGELQARFFACASARATLRISASMVLRPRKAFSAKMATRILALICQLIDGRPTYGYRRVTGLVNRVRDAEGKPAVHLQAGLPGSLSGTGFSLKRTTGRRKDR